MRIVRSLVMAETSPSAMARSTYRRDSRKSRRIDQNIRS
jgi:hypothetical protein